LGRVWREEGGVEVQWKEEWRCSGRRSGVEAEERGVKEGGRKGRVER